MTEHTSIAWWFWFGISHTAQSDVVWGCSPGKARLGLEDLLPRLLTMWLIDWLMQVLVALHISLFTEQLEGPRMLTGFPQSNQSKGQGRSCNAYDDSASELHITTFTEGCWSHRSALIEWDRTGQGHKDQKVRIIAGCLECWQPQGFIWYLTKW